MNELILVLAKGGPVMIPLAVCSVVALAVVIERAWTWRGLNRSRDAEAVIDRAAVEAITQWHFEPARRGAEVVAVWVTLPVRFELTSQ